ncbi:MAG TPA: flavin reductase family protein [Alteraurantiacibacter sp.]
MIDPDEFKQSMSRLAGSVCIITTANEREWTGCTATAVCSLSTAPPSMIVCLNQDSQTAGQIVQSRSLCVNILGPSDKEVALLFARRSAGTSKFNLGDWVDQEDCGPRLASAIASLGCRVVQLTKSGTHFVLICEVSKIHLADSEQNALLYAKGAFGQFHPL